MKTISIFGQVVDFTVDSERYVYELARRLAYIPVHPGSAKNNYSYVSRACLLSDMCMMENTDVARCVLTSDLDMASYDCGILVEATDAARGTVMRNLFEEYYIPQEYEQHVRYMESLACFPNMTNEARDFIKPLKSSDEELIKWSTKYFYWQPMDAVSEFYSRYRRLNS